MNSKTIIAIAVILSLIILNGSWISSAYAKNNIQDIKEVVEIPVANINTATTEELQLISGIGPKLAARIIQYRNDNGTFKTIEDIMNVKGVGSSKFEKIKEHLKV